MQKPDKIDFTKLLGFATVADELLSETTDFREATLGAKLGAKVGGKVDEPETKG